MGPSDEEKLDGRLHGDQPKAATDPLLVRVLYMAILWLMLSLAQTVLTLATVVQVIIMLTNHRRPNERLAEFGTDLGIWMAKAARFQTGASEVKPWPWTELD